MCSDKVAPPTECREFRPMSLDERRQILMREAWIQNVMRSLSMNREDAEKAFLRISDPKVNI